MFELTSEQQAIVEQGAKRRGSVMVEAGAGCAKTTTLTQVAQRVREPALAVAFNKRIAEDMRTKFPGNFEVKTMNGLGHRAWSQSLRAGVRVTLDERKVSKLVSSFAKARKMELQGDLWSDTRKLVSAAMMAGLVPATESHEGIIADTQENWLGLATDEVGMFREDAEYVWELAREILIEDIRLARDGLICFDDQVYCPTLLGGKFPQFPVVFVDEDQDLNPLNHLMVKQVLRAEGRLFAVGDKRQAIYAFRGASGDSAEQLRKLAVDWVDLPLMTTFRCPKAVVARQQRHVPGFRAWEGCAEGVIVRHKPPEEAVAWEGWSWKDILAELAFIDLPAPSLFVLCRNNGPLLAMAFKLLRQGIGCQMLGRDIGRGLVALGKKITGSSAVPADLLRGKIVEWMEKETALAKANDQEEKIPGITDRGECLLAVLDFGGARDSTELAELLTKLFARTTGLATLSSIHRAKGLEADVVVHLDPWRIPSKQSRRAAAAGNYLPLEQERNLQYVCETRTKHTLVLADLEDFH